MGDRSKPETALLDETRDGGVRAGDEPPAKPLDENPVVRDEGREAARRAPCLDEA